MAPLVPTDTGTTSVYGRVNMNFAPPPIDDASSTSVVGKLVTHFTGGRGPFSGDAGSNSGYVSGPESYSRSRSASPVRRQITGGSGYLATRGLSTSPIKTNITGGTSVSGGRDREFSTPLSPQMTGSGLPITHARPRSVIGMARDFSGSSFSSIGSGPLKRDVTGSLGASTIAPQTTGGGLPVTRPRPRPKSVIGNRSGRGIELVRQITGGSDWNGRDF